MASGGKDLVEEPSSICFYYNTPGGCWNGRRCRFVHVRDDKDGPRPMCRFFGTLEGCWYEEHCYFTHVNYDKSDTKEADTPEADLVDSKQGEQVKESPVDPNNNEMIKVSVDKNIQEIQNSVKFVQENKESKGSLKASKMKKKKRKERKGSRSSASEEVVEETGSAVDKAAGDKESRNLEEKDKNTKEKDHVSCNHDIKCGECGQMFIDGKNGINSFDAIESHYLDMLGKADRDHTKIFRKNKHILGDKALCGACGKIFDRVEDLLRHLGSKYKIKRKEKFYHKDYFWEIAHQFIDRDIGISSDDENEMVEYLMVLVSLREGYMYSDVSSDEEGDTTDTVDTGMAMYLSNQLKRFSKMTPKQIDEESDERAGNHGFTEDEVYELMCQGIKPWEQDAYSALNVIYGYAGGDFDYKL